MKLKFDGISRNQQPRLRKIFEEVEFLFPHWVNEVIIANELVEDNLGSCAPSNRYRRMHIYLSKTLLSETDEQLIPVLLHEIAHGYNEEILNVLYNYIPELIPSEEVA